MNILWFNNRTAEYVAYINAKDRCNNPNRANYKYYGGKGVKFLYNSFDSFLKDVGKRPSLRHTIGRVNTEGNYEPGNCEWQTWTKQSRNRPYVKLTMAKARKIRWLYSHTARTQREIAREFGINQHLVWGIVNRIYWKE